jgi:hypothetical protein
MSDLSFEDRGIATALTQHRLIVPVNQRSYKWEAEHVEDLFTDLENAQKSGDSEYFLGTMVVTRKSTTDLEVADGQQRLATIVILLAAFRDYLYVDRSQKDFVEHIREKYLAPYDPDTDRPRPVLTLNTEDNAFFEKRIVANPDDTARLNSTDGVRLSHERIDTAAQIAKKWVGNITNTQDQTQKIRNIKSWCAYLRESARIILVIVSDPGKAFKIFETLNDRGLELSQVDLLKNHLYALAEAGKRFEDARKPWDEMIGALEASGYEDLALDYIRQMWISYQGYTKEADLYDAIKDYTKSPAVAVSFAGDLSKNVIPYTALLNPSHPVWKDQNQQTNGTSRCVDVMVNSLRIDRIRPLLLSILANFNRKETELAFRLCVSWTVRFLIVGGIGSGTIEQFYAAAAKRIRNGDIPDPAALAAEMKKHVPTNEVFKEAFSDASVTRGWLARYYLRCLEGQHRGESNPALAVDDNPEEIDLEHIIPKKPSKKWNLTEDQKKLLVNRIGNLALLEKKFNSTLKSDGFGDKRTAYSKSSQTLIQAVAKEDAWGAEEIDNRQKRLAELAIKTWPITIQA